VRVGVVDDDELGVGGGGALALGRGDGVHGDVGGDFVFVIGGGGGRRGLSRAFNRWRSLMRVVVFNLNGDFLRNSIRV